MNKKNILVFILILILAVLMVWLSFFFIKKEETSISKVEPEKYSVSAVTPNDHILGNPSADVIVVEYADLTCGYCREFHKTMRALMDEYGRTGEVAWVFRHFPSISAISKEDSPAKDAALAAECTGYANGESKFWEYVDGIFGQLPTVYDKDNLRDLALVLMVDMDKYDTCLATGQFEKRVQKHINDGLEILGHDSDFGTPYSFILTKDGTKHILDGAQPYEILKQIIQLYSFPDSI